MKILGWLTRFFEKPKKLQRTGKMLGIFICWLCKTKNNFIIPNSKGRFTGDCKFCQLSCNFDFDGKNIEVVSIPGEVSTKGLQDDIYTIGNQKAG
jgi:hypothetical protein